MENSYLPKTLVIVGAQQDTPGKLAHTLDLLLSLKKSGVRVCFSTHCSYGLDKISEVCDYLIFDSNNIFVDEYELINYCHLFGESDISQRWSTWYSISGFGKLQSFLASTPHQRSALSLIKNGTQIAYQNSFEWSIYMEYDYSKPEVDFSRIIEDSIGEIISSGKDSLFLMRKNEGFVSGGFMIYRTKVFRENGIFSSQWEKNSLSWFSTFRNMFFEEIIESVAFSSGDNSIVYVDEEEFFNKYWGKNSKEVSSYSAVLNRPPNRNSSKVTAIEYLKYSFFPYKEGEEYGFILAAYNWSDKISFKVTESKARVGEEVIEIPAEVDFRPGDWRTFHSGHIGNIPESEGSLYLEFKVQSDLDDYKHHIVQEVPVSSIDKFWMLRRFEKDES